MSDKAQVIAMIREAFRETPHPGDAFLQGSREGCEPSEAVAPFMGITDWQQVDPSILDSHYTSLSFFSEGGFRFFLPAFVLADLDGRLHTADPVFHLTHGFSDSRVTLPAGTRTYDKTIGKSALVNPRRYGAMTTHDHARCRLSVFTREEAGAIVAYLEFRRDLDQDGLFTDDITAALEGFWKERAQHAPQHRDLRKHVAAEEQYLKDICEAQAE